jgi:5-hydroxyisourate hydrolase
MSPITTHVLDLNSGRPARGMSVVLSAQTPDGLWEELATGMTDLDGRARDLLPASHPLSAGVYRLRFDTAAYFHSLGVPTFYPDVVVTFQVTDSAAHHHVPLLLSPFGYSTYRGS